MRLTARLVASVLLCAASAVAAHADTLTTFSVTGGDGTFSFSLPSSATPSTSNNNAAGFSLSSATYNGTPVSGDTVYFYTTSGSGGFYLTNPAGTFDLDEYGPQIFSGTTSMPVFTTMTYTLSNGSADGNGIHSAAAGDVLTVTTSVSPVPEPSTLALFGTGILGLAGFGRRALSRA